MDKEFCFLLLLILTIEISSIKLGSQSKVVSTIEEYGLETEGSSISLRKTKRNINHSISLLAEYQDTIIDYNVCIFYILFSDSVEEYDPNDPKEKSKKKDCNTVSSKTTKTKETVKKIPLRNYKNTQVKILSNIF